MEREILFRGKRVGNGEWTEGLYSIGTICSKGDFYLAPVIRKKPQKRFDTDWDEVIPETVGQYTGLTDKNGVRIFEGDILSENGEHFIVVYDNKWAKFKLQYIHAIQYPEWNRGILMKVIGNVHDNPELLKGEELKNGQD